MFAERLRQALSAVGASPARLARHMGIDPSNISRMLTAKRTPKVGGAAAWRLVGGLFAYADEGGRLAELCALMACEGADSAGAVKSHMMSWLYEGVDDTPRRVEPPRDRAAHRVFGERLGALMELAGLSNVQLGRLINVDASYVSRFRHGLRSPRSNPRVMDAICSVLLDRLRGQGMIRQLGELMGTPPEVLADEGEAHDLLHGWLFGADEGDGGPVVEELLESIDAFSLKTATPLPSLEEAVDEHVLRSKEPAYFGTGGLQSAAIRFLSNAIRRGATELCLYSDQDMAWMVGDPVFHARWSALMLECVRRGIRIRVVHSVDRDLHEMIDAITSWLPLYLSGTVESYYCTEQRGARFSTTLFLCPGVACVEGGNVRGQEDQSGVYRYHSDAAMLEAYGRLFDGLLAGSKRLVRICHDSDGEVTALAGASGMTVLGTTLTLATMPEATLCSMLERSGVDEGRRRAIRRAWEGRRRLLAEMLDVGHVYECVPVADDELLLAGEIPADVCGASLAYSPQDYAEHVRNVIALSDTHANYRLYALPDAPFANTQVVITEGVVVVGRIAAPQVSFVISHPALCAAFAEYASRIKGRYEQDKMTMRRLLARYL